MNADDQNPKIVPPGDIEFDKSSAEADPATGGQASLQKPVTPPNGIGLEGVTQEAIDLYVKQVGTRLGIEKQYWPFAAYFFCPEKWSDDKYCMYAHLQMTERDVREAFSRVIGPLGKDEQVLTSIFGQAIGNTEKIVVVPQRRLPEIRVLQTTGAKKFENSEFPTYFQIMKFPPRGRTFYAGLIHRVNPKIYQEPGNFTSGIILGVTTAQVLEYAKDLHMLPEVSEFLDMYAQP